MKKKPANKIRFIRHIKVSIKRPWY